MSEDRLAPVRCAITSRWALLASCLVATVGTPAQELRIEPGNCNAGVHVVARQRPLVDVLKELARVLDFQLKYEGDAARTISVDATRSPVELIGALSPQDSMVVTQAPDPKCKGRNRIVKVWVLPQGKPSTPAQGVASVSGLRPAPLPPPPEGYKERVIPASRELDEQSRRAKAAYDEYVRIHGVAPPGVPEESIQN